MWYQRVPKKPNLTLSFTFYIYQIYYWTHGESVFSKVNNARILFWTVEPSEPPPEQGRVQHERNEYTPKLSLRKTIFYIVKRFVYGHNNG